MDTIDVILIIAILFLICLSAFFSATETAFSSVNKIRLKNLASNGNKKAARALKMSENYDDYCQQFWLVTILPIFFPPL